MCGRYALHARPEVVALAFGLPAVPSFAPRWNIAPGSEVLAVRLGTGRELARLRWGLVPHWARDPAAGPRPINARVETAARRPAFRDAFRHRRCLLPASGYYEWRNEAGRRVPYYVYPADQPLLAFAGLWDRWEGPARVLETCVLLTTEAQGRLREIHERMPVVLPPPAYEAWLVRGELPLAHAPALELCAHRVGAAVNRTANEGPALIEPARET